MTLSLLGTTSDYLIGTTYSKPWLYNFIVVEGVCDNCSYVQPRHLKIEDYLARTLIRVNQQYRQPRCHHCKDKGTVVLTNL